MANLRVQAKKAASFDKKYPKGTKIGFPKGTSKPYKAAAQATYNKTGSSAKANAAGLRAMKASSASKNKAASRQAAS